MGRAGQPEAVGVLEGGGQLQVLGGPSEMRPGWGKTEPGSSHSPQNPSLLGVLSFIPQAWAWSQLQVQLLFLFLVTLFCKSLLRPGPCVPFSVENTGHS